MYGPGRIERVKGQELRDKLTKSSVLQDGEYNLTRVGQGEGVWQSSFARDFPTKILSEDRTVNWPDMAPQYMVEKPIGDSDHVTMMMMMMMVMVVVVVVVVMTMTMMMMMVVVMMMMMMMMMMK
nr:hypothetical protein BaRGS_022134 [Batillaria attramentaria]